MLISGIPRARAETTNLPSTGNCIAFSDFQRRRTRPDVGAFHVGQRKSQWAALKRCRSGDYGKDRARDRQEDEKIRERIGAHERWKADVVGYTKADPIDRESARPRNLHDGAGAPDESAHGKPNGAAR